METHPYHLKPLERLVNHSESRYSSKKNFDKKIRRKIRTYVVFGADWCPPCLKLKRMLESAGIDSEIVFLNASEPWVADILVDLQYIGIPYTVVYQDGAPTGVIRYGFHPSLIFLVANVSAY